MSEAAATEQATAAEAEWLTAAEKGTILGIRFVLFLVTALGRRPARAFMRALALYYVTFHFSVRRASRAYLARVLEREPTFGDCYRHVLCFAFVALDRLLLLKGREELFEVSHTGHEHLAALMDAGRGAMLVGAHLGSMEAMRVSASTSALQLNVLGYFSNARMINSLLEKLNPDIAARVIHVEPGRVGPVLDVKERVEAGELVAVLADRTGLNERAVRVRFFGEEALLPAAPFMLAGILRCPVLLVFGLYREPNRYDLYCEPFSEGVVLPRKAKMEAVRELAQRYAERVEHHCRLAPDNWFNFYDFWKKPAAAAGSKESDE